MGQSTMGSTTKAFQLIQAVVDAGSGGATFSDAVRASAVPKSTAHRLLNELTDLGALRYDAESRAYFGGLLLARFGSAVAADYDLRKIARPHLEKLHQETGHTATLGIRDGDHGIYLDKVESKEFGVRLHSEIGKAFPLHCTGIGKVLLSHLESNAAKELLRGNLTPYTKKTITSKTLLRQELKRFGVAVTPLTTKKSRAGSSALQRPFSGRTDQ